MNNNNEHPSLVNKVGADTLESLLPDKKWFDLFKDKKAWVDLFTLGDPQGEWRLLLTERKPELGERLAAKPELAELFARHPGWRDVLADHDEAAAFLTRDPYLDRLNLFLPHPAWIGLFKSQAKSLLEKLDADGAWEKSFKNNSEWLQLFISKPEWAALFLHKPEWFDRLSDDFAWAEKLAGDTEWGEQFALDPEWAFVFAYELKKLGARQGQAIDPKNLVGLAFSGGGIRSASFGLGVLEALRDFDLLKKVDYLSTVSGGGYIGAWLSANCRRANGNGVSDWLSGEAKDQWDDSIRHLRRYSNYLSPKVGLFSADTWTMAAVWLRNTLMIQLTVTLGLAVLLLVPHLLFAVFNWWPEAGDAPFIALDWRWTTVALFILAVTGIAYNNRSLNIKKTEAKIQWLRVFVLLAIAAAVYQRYDFQPFAYRELASEISDVAVAVAIALCLVLVGFFLLPAVLQFRKDRSDRDVPFDYSQGAVQLWVVLPMLAVGFFVAAIVWQRSLKPPYSHWETYGDFFTGAWAYWPFPLTVAFVSLFLLAFCCLKDGADDAQETPDANLLAQLEKGVVLVLSPTIATLVLYLLITATMLLLHTWITPDEDGRWLLKGWVQQPEDVGKWLAFVWAPPLILFAFSISIIMMLGVLGRHSIEGVREWWSRLGAWLSIYGVGWMVISVAAVYGPALSKLLVEENWDKLLGGTWIGTTIAGVFAGKSTSTAGNGGSSRVLEVVAKIAPFAFILGLLVAVSTLVSVLIKEAPADISQEHWAMLLFAAGCMLTLLLGWRVDINEFSFNAFYRNRLARCYLGATRLGATRPTQRQPQIFTGFDDRDDLPLADLDDLNGPLHIVNCALNLGGSSDLALHTRQSANFTLTPYAFGSRYRIKSEGGGDDGSRPVGYLNTREFCKRFGQPTLGQAIAVSGAAANPNMGYHTSPVTAFLMTLFNVRLGWWFPNPSQPNVNRTSPRFGLTYLLMELFGAANERSDYLSISDGGHFENLAAYELIKRQCKVIIISDGECDPEYQFEGLGTLIRMCDVDFGAKIDIDVRSIQPDAGVRWSRNRCAVGEIVYKDSSTGTLIYIKASMNGHEDTAVMQYKASHQAFPHESTSDQFYGEDQFESYRRLGRDITRRTFDPVLRNIDSDTRLYIEGLYIEAPDFIECAKRLSDIWSPILPSIAQFSRHADRLMGLWSAIGGNKDLQSLDAQLAAASPEPIPETFRSTFYFCSELIQLMENVYLDLDLEETWKHPDNEGWRTLFIQWAKSEAFRDTWKRTHRSYGSRFRYFCHRHLHLPVS